jgi:hypothetical protein
LRVEGARLGEGRLVVVVARSTSRTPCRTSRRRHRSSVADSPRSVPARTCGREEGGSEGGGGGRKGGRKTLTQGGFPAGWPREEGVSEEAGKGSGFADALPVPAPTRPVAPGSPGLGGAGGQGLPIAAGAADIWAGGGVPGGGRGQGLAGLGGAGGQGLPIAAGAADIWAGGRGGLGRRRGHCLGGCLSLMPCPCTPPPAPSHPPPRTVQATLSGYFLLF